MRSCFLPVLVVVLGWLGLPSGVRATHIEIDVPGTADPYLAGAAAGTTASGTDVAPDQSPIAAPLPLTPGGKLVFAATGQVRYGPTKPFGLDPDGNPGADFFTPHFACAEHGISSIVAPVDSLVGVFLSATPPDPAAPPATLDFRPASDGGNVPGGIDYLSLAPALNQLFFIGDGFSGGVRQPITIPTGATQLYLGTMDGYDWENNSGVIHLEIDTVPTGSEMPEPASLTLAGLGLLGVVCANSAKKRRR